MSIDQEGLDAARRFALWHIGDRQWANDIIAAYLNPRATHAALDAEMSEGD